MKSFIQSLITSLSRTIIKNHQPKIVAITGSVGKTSAKTAIAMVLDKRFDVRANVGNYNNEFGVPLTIIGAESPGRSIIGWLGVLGKAVKLAYGGGKYPNVLVLEYGADAPGDISYLCGVARPDVAILTAISPVHVEGFGTLEGLMEEKAKILEMVNVDGLTITNEDDEKVRELAKRSAAKNVSYGFTGTSGVRAESYLLETREDFSFEPEEQFAEIHFDAILDRGRFQVNLPGLIGKTQVSAALAAIVVGRHFSVPMEEIADQLSKIKAEPGRTRPLPGIKGSLLIDDSYNAAPASVKAGIEILSAFHPAESSRRIAVLGDMAELGKLSKKEHVAIGKLVVEKGIDLLVTIGKASAETHRAATNAGMGDEHAVHFGNAKEAGRWLDGQVQKGDVILVKGSQSMRMERVVKDLMQTPLKAKDLLVRQSEKWLKE